MKEKDFEEELQEAFRKRDRAIMIFLLIQFFIYGLLIWFLL